MDDRQKVILTQLAVLLLIPGFAVLAVSGLWSIQSRAETMFKEWVSRGGYRVVRRTWANIWTQRGPFRWTSAAVQPVLVVELEDGGLRRGCWVAFDVLNRDPLAGVSVVWKDAPAGET